MTVFCQSYAVSLTNMAVEDVFSSQTTFTIEFLHYREGLYKLLTEVQLLRGCVLPAPNTIQHYRTSLQGNHEKQTISYARSEQRN